MNNKLSNEHHEMSSDELDQLGEAFKIEADSDNDDELRAGGTKRLIAFDYYKRGYLKASVAGAGGERESPTEAMLDMLGRLHPFEQPRDGDEARTHAYERLERAFVIQQPWPVPDQAAIVWRADLMDMRYDLVHKQAVFESWKRERATQTEAARDVLAERRRQVEMEGYNQEHDDEHACGEIAAYAAFYALPQAARHWPAEETGYGNTFAQAIIPEGWSVPEDGDRRRELVKAGALILAEIERMDRAALSGSPSAVGKADGNAVISHVNS